MPSTPIQGSGGPSLRFVFGHKVISRTVQDGATLADVAGAFSEIGRARYGRTIAIEMIMAPKACRPLTRS